MAPGSYLLASHLASDLPEMRAAAPFFDDSRNPMTLRSRSEIEDLLADFDLIDPGVVYTVVAAGNSPRRPPGTLRLLRRSSPPRLTRRGLVARHGAGCRARWSAWRVSVVWRCDTAAPVSTAERWKVPGNRCSSTDTPARSRPEA